MTVPKIQFIIFSLTGAVAAGINFYSRIIISQWYSYSYSIIFSYFIGMFSFYILARMFVFRDSKQKTSRSVFFFIIINLVAIIQIWLVSNFLLLYFFPWTNMGFYVEEISHAIGLVFPIITSFYGHKFLSFKN